MTCQGNKAIREALIYLLDLIEEPWVRWSAVVWVARHSPAQPCDEGGGRRARMRQFDGPDDRTDPTDVPEDMWGALLVITLHMVPALVRGESCVLRVGHGLSEGHEEPLGEEGRASPAHG